jgi:SAM-dependent methyltransferase
MRLSTSTAIEVVCPKCRGALAGCVDGYICKGCGDAYPVVAGIADFRVTADPWLDIEADRDKARRLAAETEGMTFEEAVRAYWAMTPGTARHHAERFTAHVMQAEQRTREWLSQGETARPMRLPWLDLGCGTADLAAAAPQEAEVVGVDIALRWLVVARRRFPDDATVTLICADAAHLPFADASFGQVFSLGMLEHCLDPDGVLEEAARVLVDGGRLLLRTMNRYTLLREPHVQVWGVGWVPRRWADLYVRKRSGQRYLHHRPLSVFELGRALRNAGFSGIRTRPASLLPGDRMRMPAAVRPILNAYDRLIRVQAGAMTLKLIAPLLEGEAVK